MMDNPELGENDSSKLQFYSLSTIITPIVKLTQSQTITSSIRLGENKLKRNKGKKKFSFSFFQICAGKTNKKVTVTARD
tara:strand:+ start:134 stop:370 length:237 start_codon:yes stop_codon:yes gene_type:complete